MSLCACAGKEVYLRVASVECRVSSVILLPIYHCGFHTERYLACLLKHKWLVDAAWLTDSQCTSCSSMTDGTHPSFIVTVGGPDQAPVGPVSSWQSGTLFAVHSVYNTLWTKPKCLGASSWVSVSYIYTRDWNLNVFLWLLVSLMQITACVSRDCVWWICTEEEFGWAQPPSLFPLDTLWSAWMYGLTHQKLHYRHWTNGSLPCLELFFPPGVDSSSNMSSHRWEWVIRKKLVFVGLCHLCRYCVPLANLLRASNTACVGC
jgi:hypothetical protein